MPKHKQRIKLRPYQRNSIAYTQHYNCNICKQLLGPSFHIDHIVPLCMGGPDEISNMQALCYNCHGLKTEREYQEFYEIKKRLNSYWNKNNLMKIII